MPPSQLQSFITFCRDLGSVSSVIKTLKTFGLTTGVLLDYSHNNKMMLNTVLLITTYLL